MPALMRLARLCIGGPRRRARDVPLAAQHDTARDVDDGGRVFRETARTATARMATRSRASISAAAFSAARRRIRI